MSTIKSASTRRASSIWEALSFNSHKTTGHFTGSYCDIPAPTNGQSSYAVIHLARSDRIRVMGVSEGIIQALSEGVETVWGPIRRQGSYFGYHEFVLRGTPFYGIGQDYIKSRALVTEILTIMAVFGWNAVQTIHPSKRTNDCGSIYFELSAFPPQYPEQVSIFALALQTDLIRIIGTDSAPTVALYPLVYNAIQAHWSRGIRWNRDFYGAREIKLSGKPWYSMGEEETMAHTMLAQIAANFREHGFKIYCSVAVGAGPSDNKNLETIFFRRVNEDDEWHDCN